MRKIYFYLLPAAILFLGCSSQTALKLNDAIVKANEDLRIASEDFNKKFEAITTHNFSILEPDRKHMVSLINQKIKNIFDLKADMPGGEDFRNAFVDYFKYEKDIYETDYKIICSVTGAEDQDKLTELAVQMKEKGKKEDAMEKSIHSEQEKFAKKNNLKLR